MVDSHTDIHKFREEVEELIDAHKTGEIQGFVVLSLWGEHGFPFMQSFGVDQEHEHLLDAIAQIWVGTLGDKTVIKNQKESLDNMLNALVVLATGAGYSTTKEMREYANEIWKQESAKWGNGDDENS